LKGGISMGKVYVLRKSAEKHSRNMLLFTTIIIGSVFGLAACNNNANEETPVQDNNNLDNNGVNDSGINDNGMNNGQEGNGVINGVDTNDRNGVNNNGTTNNNNINEGTNPNDNSFKDEAERIIDDTEDAIRGEDGNRNPE
jgi:hypothetical protein